ncbi:MAG TPA: DUF4136 domain-containing protein [Cellvibrio sp.]|nr:DUF4136 domain-containing protein [Cellvibrio sp.]
MQAFSCINTIRRILLATLNLLLLLPAACALLLLSACASNNHISQDFKPGTDYKQLKTFSWHNVASEIPNINNIAIQRAVEENLKLQGFQLVHSNADFILDINIIAQRSTGGSTGLGLSIGLPIGNHGSLGVGTSKLLGRDDKQEGMIIIDITTQKDSQVIWRGTADAVPMNYFLLRNEPQLNAILKRLIAQFPPR